MKITVAEWDAFMEAFATADPEGNWYYDDQDYSHETDEIDQSGKIQLTGFLAWQGKGDPCPSGFLGNHSLAVAVRRWRKSCAFDTHVIQVPKDKIDDVRLALSGFGIKI